MKIKLAKENDVFVLVVTDSVSAHEAKVVKAGIIKLAKDGKDKIVVLLADRQDLDIGAVAELADVNDHTLLLGSTVVLSGAPTAVREKLRGVPAKNHLHAFDSLEYGIKYFTEHLVAKVDIPDVLKVPGHVDEMDFEELEQLHNEIFEQNKIFKELLKDRSIDEVKGMRMQNASLLFELSVLEELANYMKKHSKPRLDAETYYQKQEDTEKLLLEFMNAAKVYVY